MADNPNHQDRSGGDSNSSSAEDHKITVAIDSFKRSYEAAQRQRGEHEGRSLKWTRRTAVAAITYTFFTGLIIIASGYSVYEAQRAVEVASRAADAATKQAAIAENTEKRQLRACVFVAATTMHDFVATKKPFVKVRIRNFGQTPAYEVTVDLGINLRDLTALGSFADPGHQSPPTPLGPGVDIHPILTADRTLDEPAIAAITANRSAYFVFGIIRYKDAFGKAHWSRVRWIFGADELADGSGSVGLYREGNDSDQDP